MFYYKIRKEQIISLIYETSWREAHQMGWAFTNGDTLDIMSALSK